MQPEGGENFTFELPDFDVLSGAMAGSTIVAEGLHKRYGDLHAVRGIDLTIGAGDSLALLGPNGAGKTTTLHMLVGVIRPDEGTIRIDDQPDPTRPEVRAGIGVAPQELSVYPELTAAENLRLFARLYGLSGKNLNTRVDWGIEFAGLKDRRADRVSTYSGGMKRRLNLACALVHEPRLLLCDEPTVGVDPQSRNHLFDCIEEIHRGGTTLIYTTHYMVEAERLCARVAIMDHGQILTVGTPDELIDQHGGEAVVRVTLGQPPEDLQALPGEIADNELTIPTTSPYETIDQLRTLNLDVRTLSVERPGLEQVFLALTGRSLRD